MPKALKLLLVTLVALATNGAVAASDAPTSPMTYAFFEYAVPHLDLDECPTKLAHDDAFCRASVASDALHVFVFALEGEQCLLSAQSYTEEEIGLTVP